MTQEEKAKAYDKAIEKIKYVMEHGVSPVLNKEDLKDIFPELAESGDERIRKELIEHIKANCESDFILFQKFSPDDVIAWLEKQGQKPIDIDKVEPKFHKGDWVVLSTSDGEKVVQIDSVEYFKSGEPRYITSEGRWFGNGTKAHLWTIQDAKDGDVLVASDDSIFIFKGTIDCACKHYVALTTDNIVELNEGLERYWETSRAVHPATKEQRDLLFQKMKEAGYEWDAEKKELGKIENIPVLSNSLNTGKDEKCIDNCCLLIGAADDCYEKTFKDDCIHYLQSLKERIAPKPKWTDEDEKRLQSCISSLQGKGLMGGVDTINTKWLKSLKQRMEQ